MNVNRPPSPLVVAVRQHPLVCYFVLAYLLAWLTWLPILLGQDGSGFLPMHVDLDLVIIAGTFIGPTAAAFITTSIVNGPAGVMALLRGYARWRVGVQWYLYAIFGILALEVAAAFLVVGNTPFIGIADHPWLLALFPVIVFANVNGGPLGEEGGWRGFALPRLQRALGPLWGTLVLGVLWAGWHLPVFLVPSLGWAQQRGLGWFTLAVTSAAVLITWVYNHSGGSLILTILTHAALNSVTILLNMILPFTSVPYYYQAESMGLVFAALLVIALTRGRLGYVPPASTSTGQAPTAYFARNEE